MLRGGNGTSSHTRPVREALVQLSMCGRLEGIVVEDARVVVDWGDGFRWSNFGDVQTSGVCPTYMWPLLHTSSNAVDPRTGPHTMR
jgi:hypothetical protein